MRRLPTLLLAAIAMSLAAPGVPRPTPSLERTLETHHVFARALAEGERVRKAGLLTVLGLVGLAAVVGKYEMEGPIEAEVVRVVDGDTLTVRARIWIGQELTTNVRLSGVNAPELAGSCEEERALAQTARRFLAERVEGRPVRLRKIGLDKFGGRVVASVEDGEGDLAAALLAARLAVPYDGGRRKPWCE